MPDSPRAVELPACPRSPRLLVSLSHREVSGLVTALALLNVVAAFLLTARPLPSWLELHRFASDLDTAAMMGAVHVGLACAVILFAARGLFHAPGRRSQLVVLGGVTLLATVVTLARYWAHPVQQQVERLPIAVDPGGVPIHGSLPGGR